MVMIALYVLLYLVIGLISAVFILALNEDVDENGALILFWPLFLTLSILACLGTLAKFISNKISGR